MSSQPETSKATVVDFLSLAAGSTVRRAPALLLLAAVGTVPLALATGWALDRHVRLVSLDNFLNNFKDSPTQAVTSLLGSTADWKTTLMVLLAASATLLLLAAPATTHLMARQTSGQPVPWWRSLLRSLACLPRVLLAWAVALVILTLPIAVGLGTGAWLLLGGATSWQEPAWNALVASSAAALLALWIGVRLAYLLPASVDSPWQSLVVTQALQATRRRWLSTFTKGLLTVLTASGLTGAAVSLLMPDILHGSPSQVRTALTLTVGLLGAALLLICGGLGAGWGMESQVKETAEHTQVAKPQPQKKRGTHRADARASKKSRNTRETQALTY